LSKSKTRAAEPARAQDPDAPAEEPAAAPAWPARARAALARLLRVAAAAFDAGVTRLRGLRRRAGAAQEEDEARADEPRRSHGAPAQEEDTAGQAEPQPRRLRGALAYLSVLLLGGAAGGALAYGLLGHSLEQRTAELRKQQAALAAQAKVQVERKEMLEKQALRTQAEARPALLPAERAKDAPRAAAAGSAGRSGGGRGSQAGPDGAGDCALGGSDIGGALKRCIEEFNRR
jgi:hypothetical protein